MRAGAAIQANSSLGGPLNYFYFVLKFLWGRRFRGEDDMRVSVVAGCLLVGLMGSAFAADIGPLPYPPPAVPPVYVPAAPPPPPPYNWSGFYVGIDGGYGFGQQGLSQPVTDPFGVFSRPVLTTQSGITLKGYDLGGHAGYNFQRGMWLGGLELDMSTTGIQGTNSVTVKDALVPAPPGTTVSASINEKLNYLGSARARVGILPLETVLLYGTGGLGWTVVTGGNTLTATTTAGGPFGSSQTSTNSSPTTMLGWVVGAGVEASLAGAGLPDVLVRVEYLFYDFGSGRSSSSSSSLAAVTTSSASSVGLLTANVVRGGLSIKF
jgi:outer membrane immunogenic protein